MPSAMVYVGGLSPGVSSSDFEREMEKMVRGVTTAQMHVKKEKNETTAHGVITFATPRDAARAMPKLVRATIHGHANHAVMDYKDVLIKEKTFQMFATCFVASILALSLVYNAIFQAPS
eukprot:1585040-Prymnesium_polylepis.1